MLIYHIVEGGNELSTTPAIGRICVDNKWKCIGYSIRELKYREIDKTDIQDVVFIIDSAYLKICKMTVSELRTFIKNGKIICVGSDSVWYMAGGQHDSNFEALYDQQGKNEIVGVGEVDLWMDMMDAPLEKYSKMGIKTLPYMWTVCQDYIDKAIELFGSEYFDHKLSDFICLIGTGYNDYRLSLIDFLNQKNKVVTRHIGHHSEQVLKHYHGAWINLGTTSPSWTDQEYVTVGGHYTKSKNWKPIRTMKGFRDWVSPYCNTLLIYDDFPEIRTRFDGGKIVPLYNYNNFNSIIELYDKFVNNKNLYIEATEAQKEWIKTRTIDIQLKHAIEVVLS